MKRSTFFASLLGIVGIGKAQQGAGTVAVAFDGLTAGCSAPHPIFSCGKAVNNQCPLCGEMARPYKRKTEQELWGGPCLPPPVVGSAALSICVPSSATKLAGPMRVQVDGGCKRCGAAFWQDAE